MSDREVEAIDQAAVECLESIAQALSAYARLNGAQSHKQKQSIWDSLSFHKDEAELHHAQAVSALKGLVERGARSLPLRTKHQHSLLVALDNLLKSVKQLAAADDGE